MPSDDSDSHQTPGWCNSYHSPPPSSLPHADQPLDFSTKRTQFSIDNFAVHSPCRSPVPWNHPQSEVTAAGRERISSESVISTTSDLNCRSFPAPNMASPPESYGFGFASMMGSGINHLSHINDVGLNGSALMPNLIPLPFNFINGNENNSSRKPTKVTRPFKAYPRDPLSLPLGYYGLAGVNPFAQLDGLPHQSLLFSDSYAEFRRQVLGSTGPTVTSSSKVQHIPETASESLQRTLIVDTNEESKSPDEETHAIETPSIEDKEDNCSGGDDNIPSPGKTSSSSAPSPTPSSTMTITSCRANTTLTQDSSSLKKKPRSLPEELKDEAYWERRRKNNEAAKRSRDARRAKEDEIAIRAAFLEQENLKLRVEVAALKNETAKLRCLLYNS